MKKILSILILSFFIPSPAWAATYNYYVSDDATGNPAGSGSGVGSEADPFKTLSEVNTAINALNSDDIANIYFDKSDIWTMDTDAVATTIVYGHDVDSTDPVVNINAYGTGDKPKFYGTISQAGTWFDAVPAHNSTTGPYGWNTIFRLAKDGCSISNIWIDGVFGRGITLGTTNVPSDNSTISNCDITNFGSSAITVSDNYSTQNSTIENCLIHTGYQLILYGKLPSSSWGSAICMQKTPGSGRSPSGNTIRKNVVYDIAGEGIICPGSTTEYNIVGDTGSMGIYVASHGGDGTDSIVRYNFVVQSSSTTYSGLPYQPHLGISVNDEQDTGINTNATYQIYGNIAINRLYGIAIRNNAHTGTPSPYKEIRVFNNTIIDSSLYNIYLDNYDKIAVGGGYFHNNSSILYDRTSSTHALDMSDPATLSTYWTILNNAFWTTGGSPTVDVDWRTNYVTTDPLLAGEPAVNWDGQTGATYPWDITIANLVPQTGSSLIGAGADLSTWSIVSFLKSGADYSTLPDSITATMADQGPTWDIGAIIYGGVEAITSVTASGNPTETDIVNTGATISLQVSGTTFNTLTDGLKGTLAGDMNSDGDQGAYDWDTLIRDDAGAWWLDAGAMVLNDDSTILTILVPAFATYSIAANQSITIGIDATLLASGEAKTASPAVVISNVNPPSGDEGTYGWSGYNTGFHKNGATLAYHPNGTQVVFAQAASAVSSPPVEITKYVAANDDDGYYLETSQLWYSQGVSGMPGAVIRMGLDSEHRSGCFRFDVDIPSGATIVSAYLILTNYSIAGSDGAVFDIYAADVNDSAQITSKATYETAIATLTAASVNWPISAPGPNEECICPNLATVVQEVVDDGSGSNHLQLFLKDTASTTTFRPWAYEYGAYRARLVVTYTE